MSQPTDRSRTLTTILFSSAGVSFLFAALSYAAFLLTDGRGAWPSTPKYLVVLSMYGFTILGTPLLLAACLAKLVMALRPTR